MLGRHSATHATQWRRRRRRLRRPAERTPSSPDGERDQGRALLLASRLTDVTDVASRLARSLRWL